MALVAVDEQDRSGNDEAYTNEESDDNLDHLSNSFVIFQRTKASPFVMASSVSTS